MLVKSGGKKGLWINPEGVPAKNKKLWVFKMITYPEMSLIDKISLKLPNEKISILNSVNKVCAETSYLH